mgnify:CR=1 FL=1
MPSLTPPARCHGPMPLDGSDRRHGPHAVSRLVEGGREGRDGELARSHRQNAAAHAALGRQADGIGRDLPRADRFVHAVEPRVLAEAEAFGERAELAALLERERGAEVIGITVKLWADPETDGTKACCSPEAVLGARALTHDLDIPHFTLDLEGPFRERVVGEFLRGYGEGRTPNPCVLCNGEVRIAAMVDLADRLGASHLVTGHYARVVEDGEGALIENGLVSNYYNSIGASIGLQAGAQSYGYVVFLMTDKAVKYLRDSKGWEIGVGPTVAIVDEGVAKNFSTTTLKEDAYAFIFNQQGLMAGINLEGTKISRIKE